MRKTQILKTAFKFFLVPGLIFDVIWLSWVFFDRHVIDRQLTYRELWPEILFVLLYNILLTIGLIGIFKKKNNLFFYIVWVVYILSVLACFILAAWADKDKSIYM